MCESVVAEEKRLTVGPTKATLLRRIARRLSLRGLIRYVKPEPAQRRSVTDTLLAVACGLASQGAANPYAGIMAASFLSSAKQDKNDRPQ